MLFHIIIFSQLRVKKSIFIIFINLIILLNKLIIKLQYLVPTKIFIHEYSKVANYKTYFVDLSNIL